MDRSRIDILYAIPDWRKLYAHPGTGSQPGLWICGFDPETLLKIICKKAANKLWSVTFVRRLGVKFFYCGNHKTLYKNCFNLLLAFMQAFRDSDKKEIKNLIMIYFIIL